MNGKFGLSEMVGTPDVRPSKGMVAPLPARSGKASSGEPEGAWGSATTAGRAGARQGHKYGHKGRDVIALGSGWLVDVAPICSPWLGEPYPVLARNLTPLPMRYFHGEVPK